MTSQQLSRNCDGGHSCSPPKECCKAGCCYLVSPSVYRPPTVPSGNLFNPLFLGHWYFWLAVTATVAGILCACSLWRRHSNSSGGGSGGSSFCCCQDANRDERTLSEPDSNGSCYAPPQYSRCSSFHQGPPPYGEVTSKPDLYPLVICYNDGDTVVKNNGSSTGYLVVQYFRNFIVRPVGSLSGTSTIDSLSSSFICNAANEANTQIPPPYSCMGSLEEVPYSDGHVPNPPPPSDPSLLPNLDLLRSSSDFYLHSPQVMSANSAISSPHITNVVNISIPATPTRYAITSNAGNGNGSRQIVVSIRDNPCFGQISGTSTNIVNTREDSGGGVATVVPNFSASGGLPATVEIEDSVEESQKTPKSYCDASSINTKLNRKAHPQRLPQGLSQDSDSEHQNFSDLLNLSVCAAALGTPVQSSHCLRDLQFTTSMTGSDISSLANLGTPDSPPRATSPTTTEMRELLDKIQQLPQQKSPIPPAPTSETQSVVMRSTCCGGRAERPRTMYMPLHEGPNTKIKMFGKGWMSRSAPTTPSGGFNPNFPILHKRVASTHGNGSKDGRDEKTLLLREHEEEEEDNANNCL